MVHLILTICFPKCVKALCPMPKKGFPLKSWIILYYLDAGDPVMNGWWRFGCDLEESILLVCDISQKNIEKQF